MLLVAVTGLGSGIVGGLCKGIKEVGQNPSNLIIDVVVGAGGGALRVLAAPILETLPDVMDHIDVVIRDSLIAGLGYLAKATMKNEDKSIEAALKDMGTGAGLSLGLDISESTGVTSDVLQAIRNSII